MRPSKGKVASIPRKSTSIPHDVVATSSQCLPTNRALARLLRERARQLAGRHENLYRVRALRRAALILQGYPQEVATLWAHGGRRGLQQVPGIGRRIARLLDELLAAGPSAGRRPESKETCSPLN